MKKSMFASFKYLVLLGLTGLLLVSSPRLQAQSSLVYISTPSAAITHSAPVHDTLTITETHAITNLKVMVNITHSHSGDLTLRLQHVDTGTTITLLQKLNVGLTFGCSADAINVTFDDSAATPLDQFDCTGDAHQPAIGSYRPTNALATLHGQSMVGQWTLEIIDNVAGDNGALHSWGLLLNDASTGSGVVLSGGINDGRINNRLVDLAAPVAIYCDGDYVKVYDVVNSVGTLAFVAVVPEAGTRPDENMILAAGLGNTLYHLSTGELQVNAAGLPGEEHKEYIFIWQTCP